VFELQRARSLHAALIELPVEYRETLVLCELEELSYAECAAVLGCPVGTVRSRLHRARALLATRLREAQQPKSVADSGAIADAHSGAVSDAAAGSTAVSTSNSNSNSNSNAGSAPASAGRAALLTTGEVCS
jgi:RNA polymerase sigma-70 factor (ECF subfamily)